MIGYYVHHQGRGHLHRAATLAAALPGRVTGLSSLAAPSGWRGDWVRLPRDDDAADPQDVSAAGHLHWVPQGDDGLMRRMAALSAWLLDSRPELVVCDVSVEVALLARLHGVPVVSVVLPGDRGDLPHRTAYGVSTSLVAFWPPSARSMVSGLDPRAARRLHRLGGLARFPAGEGAAALPRRRRRTVVVLSGAGGGGPDGALLERARQQTPGWSWQVMGGRAGAWHPDPYATIRGADVVVAHAGQNAVAEIAAARRPAVIVPEDRPHREQRATARELAAGRWPVIVERRFPLTGWGPRLESAAELDGARWAEWCDGAAAERFADLVDRVVQRGTREVA
jgi:hypothetical protein